MGTTATESISVELDVVQLSSEDCKGPDEKVSRYIVSRHAVRDVSGVIYRDHFKSASSY